jgi:hypothetical protein
VALTKAVLAELVAQRKPTPHADADSEMYHGSQSERQAPPWLKEQARASLVGPAAESLSLATKSTAAAVQAIDTALEAGIWPTSATLEGLLAGCAACGDAKTARTAMLAHGECRAWPSHRAARATFLALLADTNTSAPASRHDWGAAVAELVSLLHSVRQTFKGVRPAQPPSSLAASPSSSASRVPAASSPRPIQRHGHGQSRLAIAVEPASFHAFVSALTRSNTARTSGASSGQTEGGVRSTGLSMAEYAEIYETAAAETVGGGIGASLQIQQDGEAEEAARDQHDSEIGEDWDDSPEAEAALHDQEEEVFGEPELSIEQDGVALGVVCSALLRSGRSGDPLRAAELLERAGMAASGAAARLASVQSRRASNPHASAQGTVTGPALPQEISNLVAECLAEVADAAAALDKPGTEQASRGTPEKRGVDLQAQASEWRPAVFQGSSVRVPVAGIMPGELDGITATPPLSWPAPDTSQPGGAERYRAELVQFADRALCLLQPKAEALGHGEAGAVLPSQSVFSRAATPKGLEAMSMPPRQCHWVAAVDASLACGSLALIEKHCIPWLQTRAVRADDVSVASLLERTLTRWLSRPHRAAVAGAAQHALQEAGARLTRKGTEPVARAAAVAWSRGMRHTAPPRPAAVDAARAAHGGGRLRQEAAAHIANAAKAILEREPASSGGFGGMACPTCGAATQSIARPDLHGCPASHAWKPARLGQGEWTSLSWAHESDGPDGFGYEASTKQADIAPKPWLSRTARQQQERLGNQSQDAYCGTDGFASLRPSVQFRLAAKESAASGASRRRAAAPKAAVAKRTAAVLLDSALGVPCAEEAWQVLTQMRSLGVSPSTPQLAGVRAACALAGQVSRAWEAHLLLQQRIRKRQTDAGSGHHDQNLARDLLGCHDVSALPLWADMLQAAPENLAPFMIAVSATSGARA